MSASKLPTTAVVKVMDMHGGGHPIRVIESGFPEPEGKTIAEKVAWMHARADHYRKLVMCMPRGHRDMFGVMMVTPDLPEADLGLIFFHNGGYSPMCGDGVIVIGRYAVEHGLVKAVSPETQLLLQCPCGPVTAYVTYDGKVASDVRFRLPICYVLALDVELSIPKTRGTVSVDIVWGGAFYAFIPARDLGLDLSTATGSELIEFFQLIKKAVEKGVTLYQDDYPELAFLYGVMFTDGLHRPSDGTTGMNEEEMIREHICVFGKCQIDASPCGSGTASRTALEYHRGLLTLGQTRSFRTAVSGNVFKGGVVSEGQEKRAGLNKENVRGVAIEISGRGFYTGEATFTVDQGDHVAWGFDTR